MRYRIWKKYFIVGTNDNALHDTMNGLVVRELIRCEDCRWYAYKYDGYHSECDLFKMCFDQDDYCSRAERKEE